MSKPVSTRLPAVVVEYDVRGGRKQKRFENAYEARRFFVVKDRAGKNPKLTKETER